MNLKTEIIEGHYELKLIPGEKYRINYGIHHGEYIYEGILEESDGYKHFVGSHYFKNTETGQEFSYYGYTSPYEFTSIVHPLNY